MSLRAFVCLLVISTAGLIASIAIHELTPLDQWVQDHLYDAPQHQWAVDKHAPVPRMIFYILPKYAVIALGVVLTVSLILDRVQRRADTFDSRRRFFLLMCLIFIPLTAATFKRYSGVFCPSELTRYGGEEAFRLLFQARPPGEKIGHCFPGGHASAGFSLVAFSLLPRRQTHRWALLGAALLIGWAMGVYQMAKGAHFLTHTLTTMFIAMVIALLLGVWLLRPGAFKSETDSPAEPPTVS